MAALIRGAIEPYAPSGPITALRPGTRVLDFLYCDKSPRDTLSVLMLPSDRALNIFPLIPSVSFLLLRLDILYYPLYECDKDHYASPQLPSDAATFYRYHW